MEVTSVRLLVGCVIPYRTGRHVPHAPGDVISISDLSPGLVRMLGDDRLSEVLVLE